ncbi:hypothetical protein [Nocardioides bruguierae]|uniref:Uncharacterized protein n=1 Tax=Nocardioides bruguierae TaxID=2945102 RepID=A0A9X2IGX2_9ACTN|nr:hypothetical protein [Nocardioides bruguierae]MCL8025804.1 hypothetical protein [Nocardioides bruguierae]MCM0622014.1 hypothetical protein [Nocardioides bruguierae]
MPTPEERDAINAQHRTEKDADGQVSEVSAMDPADADTPISDDQSVAGQPDAESGAVDEGPTGPNSRAGSNKN